MNLPKEFWIGINKLTGELIVTYAYFIGDKPVDRPNIEWIKVKEEK